MIRSTIKNLAFITVLAVSAMSLSLPALAEEFAIVVHASNSAAADDAEIKSLYLKQRTTWSNGLAAEPLARTAGSPEQEAFLKTILGMSQADVDNFWAAEKSKSGATGPREVGSANILLRQIERKEGAFGVVTAAEAAGLPSGVKVLKNF